MKFSIHSKSGEPQPVFMQSENDYHNILESEDLDENKILTSNLRFLKEKREKNLRRLFVLFIVLGIPVSLLFLNFFFFRNNYPWLSAISWTAIGFVFVLIISILINLRLNLRNIDKVEGKIDNLIGFSKVKKAQEYFNKLVRVNVSFLEEYYAQVKRHTALSFSFSLLVGLLGFALIVTGLVTGFVNGDNQINDTDVISYISSASGVLIEFIAGVFFYLYNKTVIQLKEYHEKLVNVQNILVANQLLEVVENTEKKDDIISTMIEHLVRKKSPPASADNQVPSGT